jgi:hypothetical protein
MQGFPSPAGLSATAAPGENDLAPGFRGPRSRLYGRLRPGGADHHARPLAVGFVLLCAGLLVHAVLGLRRLAAWDTDWQVIEPQWTKGR